MSQYEYRQYSIDLQKNIEKQYTPGIYTFAIFLGVTTIQSSLTSPLYAEQSVPRRFAYFTPSAAGSPSGQLLNGRRNAEFRPVSLEKKPTNMIIIFHI